MWKRLWQGARIGSRGSPSDVYDVQNMRLLHTVQVLAILALVTPASADVLDSAANGFTVKIVVDITAPAADVYRASRRTSRMGIGPPASRTRSGISGIWRRSFGRVADEGARRTSAERLEIACGTVRLGKAICAAPMPV
jgi:hypothetical protein